MQSPVARLDILLCQVRYERIRRQCPRAENETSPRRAFRGQAEEARSRRSCNVTEQRSPAGQVSKAEHSRFSKGRSRTNSDTSCNDQQRCGVLLGNDVRQQSR